jgi:transposase InsO family protein
LCCYAHNLTASTLVFPSHLYPRTSTLKDRQLEPFRLGLRSQVLRLRQVGPKQLLPLTQLRKPLDTLRLPRCYLSSAGSILCHSPNNRHLSKRSSRTFKPLGSFTIVDHRCSQAAIFLPCSTTITGAGIPQLYLEHLFQWFRLPQKIISDQDPRFTSHFARGLTKGLGINQNLSTAFNPQTDGLSEWTNQWVKQYLHLIAANQNEWSKWLPMATVVHNNSRNSTTGFTPSELLIGWEPPLAVEQ